MPSKNISQKELLKLTGDGKIPDTRVCIGITEDGHCTQVFRPAGRFHRLCYACRARNDRMGKIAGGSTMWSDGANETTG